MLVSDHHNSQRVGIAVGFGAYIIWGLLTIYWKQLTKFNAFELIGWRITTSVAILLAIIIWNKQIQHLQIVLRDKKLRIRIVSASILLSINWSAYVWAVVNDNIIETALGYFISPLLMMLIGFVVLREKVLLSHCIAITLAVSAIGVLTFSYGKPPWLALIIASTWSVYGYLKKQVPLSSIESLSAEVLALFIPAVVLIAVMFNRADSVSNNATPIQWVFVLLTGLMTALPLLMFGFAARRVKYSSLGSMQFLTPSMNFLIGWLLYHEPLDITRVVGFMLVWAGLIVLLTGSITRRHTRL